MKTVYLDNASTTKPVNSILEVIMPYIENYWHNPSSLYSCGTKIRNDIETVRKDVAALINAKPEEIYFTSGATEANNWAIKGFDDCNVYCECCGDIFTTPVEHKSIINAVEYGRLRAIVQYIKVDDDGIVDLNHLKDELWLDIKTPLLVSVIAANNEIGSVNDLKSISEVVHSANGIFHTDATQMLPHMPIDVEEMGIDMLSASAQKLGGLKGTGFLYIRNSIKDKIAPLIYGEQERSMRGGTENVVGIIAMGDAIKCIDYKNTSRIALTRDYIIDKLEKIGCKLIGSKEHRLPNNISVMLPESVGGESMLYLLDMSGIYISTGSACNSRSVEPSHVLKAIGLSDEEAARVIRIAFSPDITLEQIENVVNEIDKTIKLLSMQ